MRSEREMDLLRAKRRLWGAISEIAGLYRMGTMPAAKEIEKLVTAYDEHEAAEDSIESAIGTWSDDNEDIPF
jgi:hypothetical protein